MRQGRHRGAHRLLHWRRPAAPGGGLVLPPAAQGGPRMIRSILAPALPCALICALSLAAGPLAAGEHPADFAARLPIDVPPGAALVRITLPEAAYAVLVGPDL